MNFKIIFIVAVVVMALFVNNSEGKFKLKRLLKKVEGAGKRVFNSAQKALPVVQGYAGVVTAAKGK
ncbi:cecropin-C-like [Chrysoperla carnea]|uniref:cecropin-C-like n=1 Tax=Chrysoperla carnea TaxID=189513 RepID=UPI001D08DB0A|nr:cecropin-C-like [Chrysoperla carnea]